MDWEGCGLQIRHNMTLWSLSWQCGFLPPSPQCAPQAYTEWSFQRGHNVAGRAASAVLSRPGAVGKLLTIAAKSPDVDAFADALVAALGSTTLPVTASLDEMKLLLEQVPVCYFS